MNIATIEQARKREEQRFEHLVLGRPRPEPQIGPKPKGLSKQEWRVVKADLRARGAELLPGIEEAVQLREMHGGRQATPETEAQFQRRHRPSGAIARLYASKAIDADQLNAAFQIAEAYRAATADAPVRTASLEARIGGGSAGGAEIEVLGRTMDEIAIDWWTQSVRGSAAAMIEVIVHDVGLTIVADRYAMGVARTRQMLADALTLWWTRFGRQQIKAS